MATAISNPVRRRSTIKARDAVVVIIGRSTKVAVEMS